MRRACTPFPGGRAARVIAIVAPFFAGLGLLFCDELDTKPVELPRLLEKINRLLGQRGDTGW